MFQQVQSMLVAYRWEIQLVSKLFFWVVYLLKTAEDVSERFELYVAAQTASQKSHHRVWPNALAVLRGGATVNSRHYIRSSHSLKLSSHFQTWCPSNSILLCKCLCVLLTDCHPNKASSREIQPTVFQINKPVGTSGVVHLKGKTRSRLTVLPAGL